MLLSVNRRALLPALSLLLTGCYGHSLPTTASHEAKVAQRAEADNQREELALIPPPSKNRYMAIRSYDNWQNPYLTAQANMLTLHVLMADANPSDVGVGSILRPIGARRQELNISLDKLGDAMSAIPQSDWPYGRVVALEEAHKTPASAVTAVRRTMEAAVGKLNDLGIEVYDIDAGNLR
jgi:hypothetical protein